MKIEGVPFAVTDWDKVPAVEHRGETGTSTWRAIETGNISNPHLAWIDNGSRVFIVD